MCISFACIISCITWTNCTNGLNVYIFFQRFFCDSLPEIPWLWLIEGNWNQAYWRQCTTFRLPACANPIDSLLDIFVTIASLNIQCSFKTKLRKPLRRNERFILQSITKYYAQRVFKLLSLRIQECVYIPQGFIWYYEKTESIFYTSI